MTLLRDGQVVSLSKREGNVLALDEIVDEVGVDAARFFFLLLNADTPLTLDLTLAVEQSSENPVYYVQYGHARIASIERKAPRELLERAARGEAVERLTEPPELILARRLAEFPAIVRSVEPVSYTTISSARSAIDSSHDGNISSSSLTMRQTESRQSGGTCSRPHFSANRSWFSR